MLVRHPRVGDPVLVFGERGTVVALRADVIVIDVDDGLRWNVPADRLLWDGQRWNVLPVDPPLFLHEDPEYADPVTAAKAEADRVA
jgi:hypothetical protein